MKLPVLIAAFLLALAAPLAWPADFSQETAILVAKREMHDKMYGNTVIIVRPLGEDRHIGFIVNKPTTVTLGKLFPKDLPSQKVVDPVYLGGPMGPDVIFAMVKSHDSPGGRSLRLTPGLYVAFDSKVVDHIIASEPTEARFFAGMVLWQPNELREEVKRGLWYVLDPTPEILQRKPTDGLWEDLVGRAERKANTI
ncbi:MAG TPA: YqgE/AlgH family protein [Burkholderiales bacterium]|nr:YqgE/AlgH family protein [Burkholderiales bacterium]